MLFNLCDFKNLKNIKKLSLVIIFIFLFVFTNFVNAYEPQHSMKIFAVNNSKTAMVANLDVDIQEGEGKIFSSINTAIGSSTQQSERNAVLVAEKFVDDVKDKYNYFFDIQSEAKSIDGPSAGAAMALLIITMLEEKELSPNISVTGTITSDGYVGDVSGIYEKSKKASEVGIDLFFIPSGNRNQMITVDGHAQNIDLVNYAYDNWDLKVVEVETIEDILYYAYMDIDDIDINSLDNKGLEEYFIPEKLNYSNTLEPMRDIVNKYIQDSNQLINNAQESVNDSIIKDTAITQDLLSFLDYSKKSIREGSINSKSNYLYTAANNAFIAQIYSTTVDEIVSNPSILKENSTIFDLKLEDLENEIKRVEQNSYNCKLDAMEWCIGARQRITWAQNKLNNLKNDDDSVITIDKILDYSYANSWVIIAEDFLDISEEYQGPNFVESSYFKQLSQEKVIDLENELILVDSTIANNSDLLRRIDAAKSNFKKGWYVTSLYDSATALSVLESLKESNQDLFNEPLYNQKYENMLNNLRSTQNINGENNIWSRLFLDHSIYFNRKSEFYENKSEIQATSSLKTSNSILQMSINLYDVENMIVDYYNNADISNIVAEIQDLDANTNVVVNNPDGTSSNINIYSKNGSSKSFVTIYVILIGLFIIMLAIVYEIEKHKDKKRQLQIKISDLDEKLLEGNISEFSYKEMRQRYLLELHDLKVKSDKKYINKAKKLSYVHPSLIVEKKENKRKSKNKSKVKSKSRSRSKAKSRSKK